MTTSTSSTRVRHDSDATFREWGLEFSTKLGVVGLVQTADTGQINWTTVTRAGVNAEAGYEIWRFNDTQQSTSPIYIRFGYGTGAGTTTPRIQITVGSGSNGSGTITATGSFTVGSIAGFGAATTDTLRNSYWAAGAGYLAFLWKSGDSVNHSEVVVGRTVDSSGAADADGAMVIIVANNFLTTACMNFVGTDTITTKRTTQASSQLCNWPQTPTASLVGSDQQVSCAYGTFPRFRPIPWFVGCLNSEFPTGNTFSVAMVGSTALTYLSCDNDAIVDAGNIIKPAIVFQ
jgi:hypothetical protein